MNDKIQPSAIDLEESLLGSLMLDKEALVPVIGMLSKETFYVEKNGMVFSAIQSLFNDQQPVDILTVTKELKRRKQLELVGGAYYVSQLTNRISGGANAEYWAFILLQQQIRRTQIEISNDIARKAYDDSADIFDTMSQAHASLQKLEDIGMSKRQGDTTETLAKDSVARYYAREQAKKDNKVTGVTTGLKGLDGITGGWQAPDLVIMAARPSMGKTATMLYHILASAKAGIPVAVFSLEMSAPQLMDRLMLIETGIDADAFKFGRLSPSEKDEVERAEKTLSGLPIYIDDTPGISPEHLRSKCGQLHREKHLGLFCVDYLQLMQSAMWVKGRNREQEISSFSSACKNICKTLNIPGIVLSQLSRAVETRGGDKRPNLSDLRESGAIEQDADLVLFLHRPEYYGILEDGEGNPTEGKMEIIIAKHRNGGTTKPGDLVVDVNRSLTSIRDIGTYIPYIAPPENFLEPNMF